MTRFALAAAGTGGHVFPALRVADELVRQGAGRDDVMFFGGDRMEAAAVPAAGYELVRLPLQGLERAPTWRNLRIPARLAAAVRRARHELRRRSTRAVAAFGGYVTIPAAWAASREGVPVALQEQNAVAGLANRVAARWAQRVYLGFETRHLAGEVVGNPLSPEIDGFDREALRPTARERYGVPAGHFVLGVYGGSLGARVINAAAVDLVEGWNGPPLTVVHLAGRAHAEALSRRPPSPAGHVVLPFEAEMHYFYAVADVVVGRSSALSTSELAATGTPSVLVPRAATRAGHYEAHARHLGSAGAAEVVPEAELGRLPRLVGELAGDPVRLGRMAAAARSAAMTGAAARIASDLIEVAGG